MKQLIFLLCFSTLLSCDFKSSEDYNTEAEKLEQKEKYAEAIIVLNKAIEMKPNNVYALINRAVDKSILKDYEGAIVDYSKVLEVDKDNTLAFLNRVRNKERLKDFIGAIEDYENAIKTKGGEIIYFDKVENPFVETGFEFDVRMEEIIYERGLARYYLDSMKTAFEDFSFCIDKNFEKPASLYWRGLIYISNGMDNAGCNNLYVSKEMGDPDAQEMIEKYCK